jgi:hypothetical protein
MTTRREIFRVTVNGRRCERIAFANGEVLYFAGRRDATFPHYRLVPASQHRFRAQIDKAISEAV